MAERKQWESDQTGTYHGQRFWYVVELAQALCARCGRKSPAIAFKKSTDYQLGRRKNNAQIVDGLAELGWDVTDGKAYCPTCRRIGRGSP
jgi:hypothetical protein